MARLASYFKSSDEAEQAASELDETQFSDGVRTQIITREDWEAIWQDTDKNEVEPEKPSMPNPTELLDIWIDEDTLKLFAEGLKQGGAVLVVDVPDPFTREAEKIMTKNNGKIG